MKASLLYNSGDGSGDAKAASEYLARLLAGAAGMHMQHLMQTGPGSFARHMALGAYDDLAEAVDSLAEAWIGCSGSLPAFSPTQVPVGGDALADVRALYAYAEQARAAMGPESHIQNEVDAVLSILSTTVYKLERLA